jgi:hypothetical protein
LSLSSGRWFIMIIFLKSKGFVLLRDYRFIVVILDRVKHLRVCNIDSYPIIMPIMINSSAQLGPFCGVPESWISVSDEHKLFMRRKLIPPIAYDGA